MPNLYGNILSSIGCGIVGGQGVLPSANFGDRYAIFEPASQYTCANLVGKDLANPCVFILAGINMLRHIKQESLPQCDTRVAFTELSTDVYFKHYKFFRRLDDYAELLQKSLYKVMFDDMIQTPDIGGTFHTSDIIENIKAEVIKRMQASKRG
ncbi:unnamed protein product [Soboliphyme baturini]|uniref:Iso_dh domain-containing protein n=1 Tax=Soboliphyme baturini TaxID=241478 RepID=A0A183ISX5_9BILA|nr:unnamed protein product [Soboliphyme baturini]